MELTVKQWLLSIKHGEFNHDTMWLDNTWVQNTRDTGMKALYHDHIHLTWPRHAREGGLRSWPLLQSHDLKTIRPSSVYRLKLLAPSISAIGWGEFYVVLHLYSPLILRGMSYQRIIYSTPAWWDHKCWGYLQEHECGWLTGTKVWVTFRTADKL